MKLIVCWGTFPTPRPGGHPCKNAADALHEAGHRPEIVKAHGLGFLPDTPFNQTSGRKRAKGLSGDTMVPVLELDDGAVVSGSEQIVAWARANPA